MRWRLLPVVWLLALGVSGPALAQAPMAGGWAALTHSRVTLDFQTVSFSVPALAADDPAYQVLLSGQAAPDMLVRVGRLDLEAGIALGHVELPQGLLPVARYDLWLAGPDETPGRDAADWSLVVASALGRNASHPADVVGVLGLTHRTPKETTPILTGGIVAAGTDGGWLRLTWGRHAWTTTIRMLTRTIRPRSPRDSGVGDHRQSGTDTSALQRASRLGWRNTVTVTLPEGARLGTVYPKDLDVDERDFAHLVSVATGAVVRTTGGAVIRLDTDVPLQFGTTTLETGNVGLHGSAGAYGVWLKRTVDGWRLVFNDEADAWGTQHDPAFDVAEVELTYVQANDPSRALSASVVMVTAAAGQFVLVWGPHQWTADFTVGRRPE